MVVSVNSTALSAAISGQGVTPSVRVRFVQEIVRWSMLHEIADTSSRPTDMRAYGGEIWRVRLDSDGSVGFATIDDPSDVDEWAAGTVSTVVAASTCPYPSDVAIERLGANCLRIAYVDTSNRVRLIDSSDGGATWNSAVTVCTRSSQPRIALAGTFILVEEGSVDAYTVAHGYGTVFGPYTAPDGAGGNWATSSDDGICGALHAEIAATLCLFCDGGAVYGAELSAVGVWSTPWLVYPGGEQTTPSDAACHDPSITSNGERVIATWIEQYTGSGRSWEQALARSSSEGIHWGLTVPLAMDATTQRRVAVTYDTDENTLYAANEFRVAKGVSYNYGGAPAAYVDTEVLDYDYVIDRHGIGRLTLTLLDVDGDLFPIGDDAAPLDTLRPLSVVQVSRGVTVGGADTRYSLPLCTIETITRSEYVGAGRVTVTAFDGWGLLDTWRPEQALYWSSRTIKWLMDELAARVGLLVCDDGDAAFDRTLPTFTLRPNQSLRSGLLQLLEMAGAIAHWDDEGILCCVHLADDSPATTPVIGDHDEIINAAFGLGLRTATGRRVQGDGYGALDEDVEAAMALGLRLTRGATDTRLNTQNLVDALAEGRLLIDGLDERDDSVTIPLRMDLELWDRVELPSAMVGSDNARRITGIRERYDPQKVIYRMELRLGWIE